MAPVPDGKELGLLDGLVQVSFLVQAVIKRVAQRHEISVVQMRLLGILRDREPGILSLAQYLELDKSSVTGLVDRAEGRGWVERVTRPEDRRAIAVRMTAAGHSLAAQAVGEVQEEMQKVTVGLSDRQQQQLSGLLSRVVLDEQGLAEVNEIE